MRERFWQEVIWVSRCLYTKWENTKKMEKNDNQLDWKI